MSDHENSWGLGKSAETEDLTMEQVRRNIEKAKLRCASMPPRQFVRWAVVDGRVTLVDADWISRLVCTSDPTMED